MEALWFSDSSLQLCAALALLILWQCWSWRRGHAKERSERSERSELLKDGTLRNAQGTIKRASDAALFTCFKPHDQTILFFAAAREVGEDDEVQPHSPKYPGAKCLWTAALTSIIAMYLIGQGANPNVADLNGETAMFFAVSRNKTDVVKALLEGDQRMEAHMWESLFR
eukprot:s4020_g2.t1